MQRIQSLRTNFFNKYEIGDLEKSGSFYFGVIILKILYTRNLHGNQEDSRKHSKFKDFTQTKKVRGDTLNSKALNETFLVLERFMKLFLFVIEGFTQIKKIFKVTKIQRPLINLPIVFIPSFF